MKSRITVTVFSVVLLGLIYGSTCWARQVVTDEDKSWAKNTIEQEESLKGDSTPNSLAILYFHNQTGWDKLNLLQKGLTLMLITDLAKIPEFQLVERVRLQALIDELKFEDTEIFSEATRIRLGNLLGAEHIIGGKIIKDKVNQFRLDSKLLQVKSDKIIASPQAVGELLAGLFQMEKKLLFEIIDQVNIALSAEQKASLEKPLSNSLTALLFLFEGVELSDRGKHQEAAKLFQKALQEDPDLDLAKEFLADINIYFIMPAAGPRSPSIMPDIKPAGQRASITPNDPTDFSLKNFDNDGDGFSENQGDCNDLNPGMFPMAMETCDGLDNNCNGLIDEGLSTDLDNDGHFALGSCAQPADDCNDADQSIYPGALEACNNADDNCNGLIDEGLDNDGDGFAACNECDDTNPAINPAAMEACNNIDDNCDGQIDEGFDNDGDGFAACNECDDTNPAINPAAMEACNNIDDNCDGQIDEGFDNDGDGFAACNECDDTNPAINPAATEACNNIDDNCDGQIDEGFDNDGDGFLVCAGDCNDFDASVYPNAVEYCDQIDNNCNGTVDEGSCTDYLVGDHPPIVDPASINEAQQVLLTDQIIAARVNNGEFRPGILEGSETPWGYEWYNTDGVPDNYTPGIQLLGNIDGLPELLINQTTLNQLNGDGFLAYAVQVEEDRLNRSILEMHRQSVQGELLASINEALFAGDIRIRDDLLMQQADAQAGRVLRDQAGNWVRVQQYILRPNDTTIQVLNVNLRGGGSQAGLSTMDFTTTLTTPFPLNYDLRSLPWNDWLSTQGSQLPAGLGEQDWRYVSSNNNSLASMSVRFTAPSGDYLTESRTFGPYEQWGIDFIYNGQHITNETLEFSLAGVTGTYNYTTDWQNAGPGEYWVFPDTNFEYTTQGNNPAPFYYMHRTGTYNANPQLDQIAPLVMTEFFAVGDGHISPAPLMEEQGNQGVSQNNYSETSFTDIWDTLRVNDPNTTSPWIGQNNLEMVFKQGFSQTASIDLVYIPMSHMAWNPSRVTP